MSLAHLDTILLPGRRDEGSPAIFQKDTRHIKYDLCCISGDSRRGYSKINSVLTASNGAGAAGLILAKAVASRATVRAGANLPFSFLFLLVSIPPNALH